MKRVVKYTLGRIKISLYYVLFLLIPVFCFYSGNAQNIDSLQQMIEQADDTSRVRLLNTLAQELYKADSSDYLGYAQKALELSKKIKDKKSIALSYETLAYLHNELTLYPKATNYYEKAASLYRKIDMNKDYVDMIYEEGILYRKMGKYDKAIDLYYKSIELYDKINSKSDLADVYVSIGVAYNKLNKNKKSREFYDKALNTYKATSDSLGIFNVLNNIGLLYMNDDKIKEAKHYYYEALALAKKMDVSFGIMISYNNIAIIHFRNNDYEKCIDYLKKSLELADKEGLKRRKATIYSNMGELYRKIKKPEKGLEVLSQALKIAMETEYNKQKLGIYSNMSQLYADINDFENAYKYHIRYAEIKDTIFNKKREKLISEMEVKYEAEKKQKKIQLLEKDKQLQKAQMKKQRIAIYSSISGGVLIMILALILYNRYKLKKRSNLQLMEKNEEINAKNEKIETQRDSLYNQAKQLKEINEELKNLTLVVRKTNNAVVITDEDGYIQWINEGYTNFYGYNILEIQEQFNNNIKEWVSNSEIEKIIQEARKTKKTFVFESENYAKDGSKIHVQTTLTPVLSDIGEVMRFIAIDTDIRKIKEAEEELKYLNATKDKFFSIIAHDLKNPFHSILGATDLMIQKYDEWDSEKQKMFLKNVHEVADQGYNLLTNLLEWSRSQTGRLNLQFMELNLNDLVRENFKLLKNLADEKNITFINTVPENMTVQADMNSIKTVLRNLFSNALKFTEQGGEVKVYSVKEKEKIKVSVQDSGIGMDDEQADKLFRIDQNQSTKGTNNEKGTGLGLILCKEFVEKNGGEIWVESKKGTGTTFHFTLFTA
jgi:PAS domain S-box-containing protein